MYARTLSIYDFKPIGKAQLALQYPGRRGKGASEVPNVNLILGDNGGGKSSVLRALAIAMLAPALLVSGFVPVRLVRRPRAEERPVDESLLKVEVVPGAGERFDTRSKRRKAELLARIERRPRSDIDLLHLESTPDSPITDLIHDDYSAAFFVVGYGATRRVETGGFSEGTARKSRGLRYQRIAGLFEDHVALRPLQAWLPKLSRGQPKRHAACLKLINTALPANIRLTGDLDENDQFIFDFDGVPTPFGSLSDGYKAFVGWVGDLVGHLADVTQDDGTLEAISGIVLVDEIDLHLHPEWQRSVVPTLSRAFPRLQFVFTSHSPLVASTVRRENVFVTDVAQNGTATLKQIDELVYGRSAEQLLLSSYFGLQTTRPESFQEEARTLFQRAAEGQAEAALSYLDRLTGPTQEILKKSARGSAR